MIDLIMINENLETDLQTWCLTQNDDLFTTKIYDPLCYLAASICARQKLSSRELLDGMVADMVSEATTKLPDYFDPKKGRAKSCAYILMSQYLGQRRQYDSKKKRNITKTVYLEDVTSCEGILEIEVDLVAYNRATLLEKRVFFGKLETKLSCKIAKAIIQAIEYPEKYESSKNSFVVDIAQKCKTQPVTVYSVLKKMRQLANQLALTQV